MAQAAPGRRLSSKAIAGYMPASTVTQHNAIDMDQAAMETALGDEIGNGAGFLLAKAIYSQGGYSKVYAQFTIPAATMAIKAGTIITGTAQDNTTSLAGTALSDVAFGGTVLSVLYYSSETQSEVPTCAKGGLAEAYNPVDGCFSSNKNLTVARQSNAAAHIINPTSYDPAVDTKAGRTLQGFSTDAGTKMRTSCPGCPYTDFSKAYAYYGNDDYSDKWVSGALDGTAVTFATGRGNADFSSVNDKDTRVESAKKGAAYMGTWMYVIREFEDAIDDCVDGAIGRNDDPVHAWDEGVAFYTGSITQAAFAPGGTGSGTTGAMPYTLAEKRCSNFMTCGVNSDQLTGPSYVNIELFRLFALAQYSLQMGTCSAVRPLLDEITALMTVPLIQGTLLYASGAKRTSTKGRAEGATFAAAMLPRLHYCSPKDAAIVYDNMRVGASAVDPYIIVQDAIRGAGDANLRCMNVTCAQIGGLQIGNEYITGGEPCIDPVVGGEGLSSGETAGVVIGVIIACVIILALGVFLCFMVKKEKAGKPLFQSLQPMQPSNARVGEPYKE